MVVAQVVERSLPTTEICGSNPDITNFISIDFIKSVLKKQKKTRNKVAMVGTLKITQFLEKG